MISSARRLRAAEVRAALSKGRTFRATHLSMKYVPGTTPLQSAAVVKKALARTAPVRNRLRRAVYRAVASFGASELRGTAVFFVEKIPTEKLTPTFVEEIKTLMRKAV